MSNRSIVSIAKYLTVLLVVFYIGAANAAGTKSLAQLKAAEDIEIVSQQIPKAFFYLHQDIRIEQAKGDMSNGMALLKSSLDVLRITKDAEQKNLVAFMTHIYNEMKLLVKKSYTKERGAIMIDYGEVLLEGAETIVAKHTHKNNSKEQMLIAAKRMSFLLERATKYYIAFRDNFNDENNVKQLQNAITEFEKNIKFVRGKTYPKSVSKEVKRISQFWPQASKFYLGVKKQDLPLIVFITTKHLEKSIKVIEKHYE